MKRGRVKKNELAVIEPIREKSREEYIDYGSALIRYGLLMHEKQKGRKRIEGQDICDLYGLDGKSIDLTTVQVQYLNMRMEGLSSLQACSLLNIDIASPMLWEEEGGAGSLYCCCSDAVRKMEANVLEERVWRKAITDPKADLMAMFALKSRMPEYRENATNNGANIVQLNVSVGDRPFEAVTETKVVSDDDQG